MSTSDGPYPADRVAPPTVPGTIAHPGPAVGARWPGVLGTLVICFSGLGVLSALLTLGGGAITVFMADSVNAAAGADEPDLAVLIEVQRIQAIAQMATGVLLLPVHTLGIVAGALLLKRQTKSVRLLRLWCGARTAVFLLSGVAHGWATAQMVRLAGTAAANDPNAPAWIGGMFGGMGLVIALVMFLWLPAWGAALPVVVWVMLGKPRAREEIERWREAEAIA